MNILVKRKHRRRAVLKSSTLAAKDFFLVRLKSKPVLLGTLLVLFYLLPATVLPFWMGGTIRQGLAYGSRILVPLLFIYLINKSANKLSVIGLVFIVTTLPGVILADYVSQSAMKWIGWVLLFAIVGPVILSKKAVAMRQGAWETVKVAIIAIGVGSFFWRILHLPNLGRGAFSGVTVHSMLLGPMAAMAALICINRAIEKRSWIFAALALFSALSCFLSGSRSAVLSLAAGVLVLLWLSIIRSGIRSTVPVFMGVILVTIIGYSYIEQVKRSDTFYAYTQNLQEKGLDNTRDSLWDARMREFQDSPLFGIGIGMGRGGEIAGVITDASGQINIEPGSSYLSLLSMSGFFGAIGFLLVIWGLINPLLASRKVRLANPIVSEVLGVSALFAVHLVGEGYIYAVGSPMCLLLWLSLGRIKDLPVIISTTKLKATVR